MRMRLLLTGDTSLNAECSSKVQLVQQISCTDAEECTIDMATAKGKKKLFKIANITKKIN